MTWVTSAATQLLSVRMSCAADKASSRPEIRSLAVAISGEWRMLWETMAWTIDSVFFIRCESSR